ncbi:SCO2322 family protein [Streptomyces beihaiensis]|uniref:SCO2322 family protein n=1 Tax=Streptomyces beihaiensis TaxID=2984495 RepID=A0ABT3TRV1_9ACTN|nr:SCO2322 family protein [Streptomyces beihaiensis]MCX3059505.1 SCO2322 family protein [Streptomyces beihaiensis]
MKLSHGGPRRLGLGLLGVLVLLLGGAAVAPAQAATGYRYWSFWERDGGSWSYATQGPSTARPSDGDVQGFRFAVSEDSKDATRPRGTADFDRICAATPARDGTKRVALVIDFGTAQDAPGGERPPKPRTACARVADDATSAEALAAVAKPLRYNSAALLCAIADYPRAGCGEQVSAHAVPTTDATSTPATSASRSHSSGPSVGVLAGVALVAALGVAAIWQARRRRG